MGQFFCHPLRHNASVGVGDVQGAFRQYGRYYVFGVLLVRFRLLTRITYLLEDFVWPDHVWSQRDCPFLV